MRDRLTAFRAEVEPSAQMVELHPVEFHSIVVRAPS